MMQPASKERSNWAAVFLWVLFIYGSIPLARSLQEWVSASVGKHLFLWVTFTALALAAIGMVRAARRGQLLLTLPVLVCVCTVFSLYAWLTWSLRGNPEESFHFVQYGVLSLLLLRAFRSRLDGWPLYFTVAMAGIGFGIIDELIQWLVPLRYFDYRDIGLNTLGVLLALLAIAPAVQPFRRYPGTDFRGLQLGCLLAFVNLLLLAFCVSNTPALRSWYINVIPGSERIGEVTAEYGFYHLDSRFGGFYSRLDLQELAHQDRTRYGEVAAVLDQLRSDQAYHQFVTRFPAYQDPLLAEARVHLFRRDRYAAMARQAADAAQRQQRYAHIAHGENTILELYFPNILHHSGYAWPSAVRQRWEELGGDGPRYHSPVSNSLITRVSQATLLGVLGILMVTTLGVACWAATRK
ncbi:VanZ family protein [Desulfobulbus alkaliphilus]|uniref:VanZ family protein n=1 Tax=Desulfobulbus alkaliphilus TaxID=869814 RepID=UPI001962ED37|nr:VanZ family protein [Desulfobulbus alkaliphilus]MBM9536637.1 VanZ family protein [Desulfobulbus alkaliphilus]